MSSPTGTCQRQFNAAALCGMELSSVDQLKPAVSIDRFILPHATGLDVNIIFQHKSQPFFSGTGKLHATAMMFPNLYILVLLSLSLFSLAAPAPSNKHSECTFIAKRKSWFVVPPHPFAVY